MSSSTSPTRVATTGRPLASASRITIGEASVRSAELCLVPIWMETREINRRADYFDFFRSNSVICDELPLDHRCISDNAGAPVTINECAVRASDRIGNATRPGEGNTRPIQRQSEPMIFRAETFYQVDPMLPAKAPEAK